MLVLEAFSTPVHPCMESGAHHTLLPGSQQSGELQGDIFHQFQDSYIAMSAAASSADALHETCRRYRTQVSSSLALLPQFQSGSSSSVHRCVTTAAASAAREVMTVAGTAGLEQWDGRGRCQAGT